jgi:hypothetical protein
MFLMDEGTNDLLAKVRARIEGDISEASDGEEPEDDLSEGEEEVGEYDLDLSTVSVLERIRVRLEGDLGEGTGQAKNTSDVDVALNTYLNAILTRLMTELGMDGDAGEALIYSTADKLATSRGLPPFPTDESSDEEVAIWVGKAKTMGFDNEVMKAA